MKYRLIFDERADADLRRIHDYAASWAPRAAASWLLQIRARIATLSQRPDRFRPAEEARRLSRPYRVTFFGRGKSRLRIYYYIDADSVVVVRVLRGGQRTLRRRDVE